jgi:hypothetical protein
MASRVCYKILKQVKCLASRACCKILEQVKCPASRVCYKILKPVKSMASRVCYNILEQVKCLASRACTTPPHPNSTKCQKTQSPQFFGAFSARAHVPCLKRCHIAGRCLLLDGCDYPLPTHRIHGAGIYANIWGILMGSMLPYIAYMDPMG